jgi:hypothetical protein
MIFGTLLDLLGACSKDQKLSGLCGGKDITDAEVNPSINDISIM